MGRKKSNNEQKKTVLKIKQATHPVAVALEGKEGFIASFQERLTLLSPIKAGVFKCKG